MSASVLREVTVPNAQGIHARPSQAIVAAAQEFDAKITLTVSDRVADAVSILSVMTLAATQGTSVRIEATGRQAESAADAIAGLIESGFAELQS